MVAVFDFRLFSCFPFLQESGGISRLITLHDGQLSVGRQDGVERPQGSDKETLLPVPTLPLRYTAAVNTTNLFKPR